MSRSATCFTREIDMQIWKLPSLVMVLKLSGHKRGVWAAAFSPLEQIVATASGDKTVKLWSIKDGACLRTLQGHNASVLKLQYLANGLQVRHSALQQHQALLCMHYCTKSFDLAIFCVHQTAWCTQEELKASPADPNWCFT